MKVAAVYDIHGNLPALEAVLDSIEQSAVDLIVCGGDIFPGPMAGACLDTLLEHDIPVRFLRGNGDRELLTLIEEPDKLTIPEAYREVMLWAADQIDPDLQRQIAGWPETVCLSLEGLGETLFCHATPRNDYEIFTRLTPEESLLEVFEESDADCVVCGHTHMQFDRWIGGSRVANAGSVGMPFGKTGAYWLLLERDLVFRCSQYDLVDAAERIQATHYPQAAEFASGNVLAVPAESEILELFSGVEIGSRKG